MKKLLNLIQIFSFALFTILGLTSCGTEEDAAEQNIQVAVSAPSVSIGSTISFSASSSLYGDITSDAVFFVNDEQIETNTYIPTSANPQNSVYAIYNGIQSQKVYFASTEEIPSVYTQKVLLEDYTGTWCVWCPRMASIVDYLADYSDKIIPVAIHTPGAPTDPWTYEFALDMQVKYSAQGAPKGKFNRIYTVNQFDATSPCPFDPTLYTPQADQYLNQNAPLGLAIGSTLNGNNLKIKVKVGFATDNVPDARLVVYLIEDGLTYKQYNGYAGTGLTCDPNHNYSAMPNPIQDFPQKHVLLKSYTDVYGDIIPQNQIANGTVWTRDFDVSLPSSVTNSQNLSIVAFVLGNGGDIANRPVINAQSAKINTEKDFD